MKLEDALKDTGSVISILGFGLAYMTLRANHQWNRRSYAAKMISEWNARIKPVTMVIEEIKPQILDNQANSSLPREITQEEARAIYYSSDPTSAEWKLKSTFMTLLNELEQIASAYENSVGDAYMIEKSFKETFVRWGDVLKNFIALYCLNRDYPEPWGPFHNLYARWKNQKVKPPRRPLGRFFRI